MNRGLWVWPGSQGTVITVETFNIPEAIKARQVRSNVKVMWTVLFDSRGVVHHEYAPQGQNINQRILPESPSSPSWCCAGQETGPVGSRNMTAASWQCTSSFLATDTNFLDQTQRSCGSTGSLLSRHGPLWFFTVPHMKTQLKGARFESWDDIIWNTMAKLYSIRKEAFQKCFEQQWNCWEKCVQPQGDYFKGD